MVNVRVRTRLNRNRCPDVNEIDVRNGRNMLPKIP